MLDLMLVKVNWDLQIPEIDVVWPIQLGENTHYSVLFAELQKHMAFWWHWSDVLRLLTDYCSQLLESTSILQASLI